MFLPDELLANVVGWCLKPLSDTELLAKRVVWLALARRVSRQWNNVIHFHFIDRKNGVFPFFPLAQSFGTLLLRKSYNFHSEGAHAKAKFNGWVGNNVSLLEACGVFLSRVIKPPTATDDRNFLNMTCESDDATIDDWMATYQPSILASFEVMTAIRALVLSHLFLTNLSELPHQYLDPFLLGVACFNVDDPTKILGHCITKDGFKHSTIIALLLGDHHGIRKLFRISMAHKECVKNRELPIPFFEPVFDVLRDAGMFGASEKLLELCCPEDAVNAMASEMPQDSFKPKATVKTVASGKSKADVSATAVGTPSKRSRRK